MPSASAASRSRPSYGKRKTIRTAGSAGKTKLSTGMKKAVDAEIKKIVAPVVIKQASAFDGTINISAYEWRQDLIGLEVGASPSPNVFGLNGANVGVSVGSVIPDIAQSVGVDGRIGNRVKMERLLIKCSLVANPYKQGTASAPPQNANYLGVPFKVHTYVIRSKTSNSFINTDTAFSNLYRSGQYELAPNNLDPSALTQIIRQPINHEQWIVVKHNVCRFPGFVGDNIAGYPAVPTPGVQPPANYYGNQNTGSNSQTHNFTIDIKAKTVLKYDDALENQPNNISYFMCQFIEYETTEAYVAKMLQPGYGSGITDYDAPVFSTCTSQLFYTNV